MYSEIIKARTKRHGFDLILLCQELPSGQEFGIMSRQLLRCSTSVEATYQSACRAKFKADFINKLKIVEEKIIK